MKCEHCGLELVNGICPAEMRYDEKNPNHYFISEVDDVIYWTKSVFWRDFFNGM